MIKINRKIIPHKEAGKIDVHSFKPKTPPKPGSREYYLNNSIKGLTEIKEMQIDLLNKYQLQVTPEKHDELIANQISRLEKSIEFINGIIEEKQKKGK